MNHQEQDSVAFEKAKLAIDLVKHISTLATGALVIICTFIDKVVRPGVSYVALITSVVSLTCCVMLCLTYFFARALDAHGNARKTSDARYELMLLGISLLLTFGLTALMVFTLEVIKYLLIHPK